MSSFLEKACSPYEEVKPSGGSSGPFVPAVTISKSCQMQLKPGGDNYYQNVGAATPCWTDAWHPLSSNQIDRLALVDRGNFDLRLILNRRGFVSLFRADAHLESVLPATSLATLKDQLKGFSSSVNPGDSAILRASLELWALQEIYTKSALRGLDSALVSLYTLAEDGARYLDTFWVFGTKAPEDAIKLAAGCFLKAEQQIDLVAGMKLACRPVVIALGLPEKDSFKALDQTRLALESPVASSLVFEDLVFWGAGYALLGYGEGVYGL